MKSVLMFETSWCPYCRKARQILRELIGAHPEYAGISVDIVDEEKDRAFSDRFDYYLVPCFYIDGKKMLEGVPTREKVEAVLKAALED